jgi:hypothetical protein
VCTEQKNIEALRAVSGRAPTRSAMAFVSVNSVVLPCFSVLESSLSDATQIRTAPMTLAYDRPTNRCWPATRPRDAVSIALENLVTVSAYISLIRGKNPFFHWHKTEI